MITGREAARANRRAILLYILLVVMFVMLLSSSNRFMIFPESVLMKNDITAKITPTGIGLSTEKTSCIYHFPVEPLYNARHIAEKGIGEFVLNDPVLNPFANCDATVQYELHIISESFTGNNAPKKTTWLLQSMVLQKGDDALGDATHERQAESIVPVVVPKTIGGDEVYVEWISNTDMGVAEVTDRHDGTYLLEFTRPPAYQYNMTHNISLVNIGYGNDSPSDISFEDSDESFGQLRIYYHYTCNVSSYYKLEKQYFTGSGAVFETFDHSHIPKPPIRDFIPPNEDGAIDLSKYDTLIPFGDSVIREFFWQTFFHDSCDHPTQFGGCPHSLSNHSDALYWIDRFNTFNGGIVHAIAEDKSIALVTGSAVWDFLVSDALRPDMTEHLDAIREYITAIRTNYPRLDIYWKAPSALHIHRLSRKFERQTVNSYIIARNLHLAQQKLMEELDIPYMDIHDAYFLSAAWTQPGDSIHYRESTLPTLLVSYFWPGLVDQFNYCNQTLFALEKD